MCGIDGRDVWIPLSSSSDLFRKLIKKGNWNRNRNCLQGWDWLSFLFARAKLRQTSVWSHLWSNRFWWFSKTADCEAMASRSLSSSSVAERWNLKGKTALVTGGTRGVGWVICPWLKRLEYGSSVLCNFCGLRVSYWVGADWYIERWGLGGHFVQVVFELHR